MTLLDINIPGQRVIQFTGVTNFRDIGGYAAADNSQVKWEQVYRSAHLCELDSDDLQKLHELGVRQSIDLRGKRESQRNAYTYDFIERQVCMIEPEVARLVNETISTKGAISVSDAHRFMQDMYRTFYSTYVNQFASFFRHVIDASTPVVVHCTAGKDRTGFACAMLLASLGVHNDDIYDDYLLTQQCYSVDLQPREGVDLAAMKVLWGVSAEYLATTLEEISHEFGSIPRFLDRALGIDSTQVALLRGKLLA